VAVGAVATVAAACGAAAAVGAVVARCCSDVAPRWAAVTLAVRLAEAPFATLPPAEARLAEAGTAASLSLSPARSAAGLAFVPPAIAGSTPGAVPGGSVASHDAVAAIAGPDTPDDADAALLAGEVVAVPAGGVAPVAVGFGVSRAGGAPGGAVPAGGDGGTAGEADAVEPGVGGPAASPCGAACAARACADCPDCVDWPACAGAAD
jgi:hypothetical protein